MKKNYALIDIFKFIFAIGIVALHTGVFSSYNNIFSYSVLHCFIRLGVPFFFTVSGFFVGIKLFNSNNKKDVIIKYIKRLLVPLIFWILINLPFQIYKFYILGDSFSNIILKLIRNLLFYPWGAMWFVLALIVALIIIMPFYKKNKIKNVVIIGAILYLFALLANNYYFLVENTIFQKFIDLYLKVFVSPRNGIFEGLYFVSVGIYLSDYIIKKRTINNKLNIIVLICSYMFLLIEIFLIKDFTHRDDASLYFMFLLFIPSFVLFLSKFNVKYDTKKLRNYSTGIFFMHSFIRDCLMLILNILNIEVPIIILLLLIIFIVVIILTILYKINNKYINLVIK